MVPGKHIISIHLDASPPTRSSSNPPVNSPVVEKAANDAEQAHNQSTDEDFQLEAAAKKLESMYL